MLLLLSPAKTLDLTSSTPPALQATQPELLDYSAQLVALLRQYSPSELANLMGISDKLAILNVRRYQDWLPPFHLDNAKPAVLAFMGEVYEGLDAASLSSKQLEWLNARLRILSGLYGVLRPLDWMAPYRLEMGTPLVNRRGRDLYAFWGTLISQTLQGVLTQIGPTTCVNLASEEYFKAVNPQLLSARIIKPVFQDLKNGQYKVISFHAKRARGLMVRWVLDQRIDDVTQLKNFDGAGYYFVAQASSDEQWVFRRN